MGVLMTDPMLQSRRVMRIAMEHLVRNWDWEVEKLLTNAVQDNDIQHNRKKNVIKKFRRKYRDLWPEVPPSVVLKTFLDWFSRQKAYTGQNKTNLRRVLMKCILDDVYEKCSKASSPGAMMISNLQKCFPDAEVRRDILLDELSQYSKINVITRKRDITLDNSLKEWKDELEKEKQRSLEGDETTSAPGVSSGAHTGDGNISPNLSTQKGPMANPFLVPTNTTVPAPRESSFLNSSESSFLDSSEGLVLDPTMRWNAIARCVGTQRAIPTAVPVLAPRANSFLARTTTPLPVLAPRASSFLVPTTTAIQAVQSFKRKKKKRWKKRKKKKKKGRTKIFGHF